MFSVSAKRFNHEGLHHLQKVKYLYSLCELMQLYLGQNVRPKCYIYGATRNWWHVQGQYS